MMSFVCFFLFIIFVTDVSEKQPNTLCRVRLDWKTEGRRAT